LYSINKPKKTKVVVYVKFKIREIKDACCVLVYDLVYIKRIITMWYMAICLEGMTICNERNERVYYVPLNTLLGYIMTATSEGMKIRMIVFNQIYGSRMWVVV